MFHHIVRDLWGKPPYSVASANIFLQCVQAFAPQFAGSFQHDAQVPPQTMAIVMELSMSCGVCLNEHINEWIAEGGDLGYVQEVLRAILDGLHEALNRVKKVATPYRDLYVELKPEGELAELTWKYYKSCHNSIFQGIFCGILNTHWLVSFWVKFQSVLCLCKFQPGDACCCMTRLSFLCRTVAEHY